MNNRKESLKFTVKQGADYCSLFFLLACAFWVRFSWMTARGFGIFNSDQAVMGLMGKHILEGKPMVYFYGQGYMGSLEAFAAAFFFSLRGMTVSSLQCAPLLFYFGFLIVNFYLLKKVFGRGVSFTANLFLAVSPPALSTLSMTSLGGYPETLFFGSLVLYAWIRYEESRSPKILFFAGLAAGIGFWVNNLILMYFFAGALYLLLKSNFWQKIHSRKSLRDIFLFRIERAPFALRLAAVSFHIFVLGFLSWQVLSFFLGPQEFSVMGYSIKPAAPIFHVKKMKFLLEALFAEGILALFLIKGIKKPLISLMPAAPFMAGFLIGGSPAFLYSLLGGEGYRLVHGAGVVYLKEFPAQFNDVILLGFLGNILAVSKTALTQGPFHGGAQAWATLLLSLSLLTALSRSFVKECRAFLKLKPFQCSYAVYPFILLAVTLSICLLCNLKSGRYLMPAYFSASLIFAFAAANLFVRNKGLACFLVLGLTASYGWANVSAIRETPSRAAIERDYKIVLAELEEKGIRGGYADYWISYELTFLAEEKIIIAPYRSENRYPAYAKFADNLEEAAYLFYKRGHADKSFEQGLKDSRISYERKDFEELSLFLVRQRGPG